jgi:hypothetical protein
MLLTTAVAYVQVHCILLPALHGPHRHIQSLLAQESLPVTLLHASILNMTNCYSSLHLLPYTTPVTATVNTRARCSAITPHPP